MTTVLLAIGGVWVLLASLICACCVRMAASQEQQMSPLGLAKANTPDADGAVVGSPRHAVMALASTSL